MERERPLVSDTWKTGTFHGPLRIIIAHSPRPLILIDASFGGTNATVIGIQQRSLGSQSRSNKRK
jgi:hypothetical protein